jgi:hypothetical protein
MGYAVKNVKSFQGREGIGFECSIYLDKKRIGSATDTASGGEINFYLDTGEREKLDKFCLTLPKWGSEFQDGKEFNTDADIYISNLVNAFELNKKIKGWCRTKTVFKLASYKDGEYSTIKAKFDGKVKAYLLGKYSKKGLVIMNETFK